MPGAVYGVMTQFGFDSNTTVAGLTKRFNFIEANVVNKQQKVDMNQLRGDLSRSQEMVRPGPQHVGGPIRTQPTALELQSYLPWMFGTPVVGTTYSLSNILQTRQVVCDRSNALFGGTDGAVFQELGCAVDTWSFKASQGGLPLELSLGIVGLQEVKGAAGTFPTLPLDLASSPFIFTDLVLHINGVVYSAADVEISGNASIDRNRFFNSIFLTGTYATDRQIMVNTHLPWAGAEALYNAGAGGVPVIATFTNGVFILTITMPSVTFMMDTPPGRERQEQLFQIEGQAYKLGSTKELTATLAVS